MAIDHSAGLRVVWAPQGGVSSSEGWWPLRLPLVGPPVHALEPHVRFGGAATVSARGCGVEASWRDPAWQPGLREQPLVVTVTPGEVRVRVPHTWRAHAYLGWRDGHLLISSDLRLLVVALPWARPAPEGVAAFLAGGRSTLGVAPSLYLGIQEVQPGHEVVVDAATRTRWHRTWTPERDPSFAALPREQVVERLRSHLDELAGRVLERYDRVACLFSGGLDSTLVAATLLRRAPEQVVLFNVGSGLGTAAEEVLRARFLRAAEAVSHPVDLSPGASLVRSLRETNAVAAVPTASLFAHVFEEIMGVAHAHGCAAVVTGDGGDEAFAEREDLLVDLLAHPSRGLPAAVGRFALRNGERGTRTLRRAWSQLRALRAGAAPVRGGEQGDALLRDGLADLVTAARTATGVRAAELWYEGWTWSGIGSFRRTAEVPEWEPLSADLPDFAVASPLADTAVLGDALDLRRDAMVARVVGGQPKWLLRQAALRWLAPEVALHPKIGSADGEILATMRARELPDLLDLFSSTTARDLGLAVPTALEAPSAALWYGDGWVRAAALVAWFDRTAPRQRPGPRHAMTVTDARAAPPPEEPAITQPYPVARAGRLRVAALVACNLAVQLVRERHTAPAVAAPCETPCSASDDELSRLLVDLARRACAVPLVSGAPAVMVRALAWYLRLAGTRPTVVRGAAQGRAATHHWIELERSVIDVLGVETPLIPGAAQP